MFAELGQPLLQTWKQVKHMGVAMWLAKETEVIVLQLKIAEAGSKLMLFVFVAVSPQKLGKWQLFLQQAREFCNTKLNLTI